MPHATRDENMAETNEDDAIRQFLQGAQYGDSGVHEGDFDQSGKDDDAVDYEDIDDDDLPEEEEATNNLDDDDEADKLVGEARAGAAPNSHVNGHHGPQEPGSDDLFGADDANDLFGEHTSPELERQTQAAPRLGGLALPKPSLALPNGSVAPPRRAQGLPHTPGSASSSLLIEDAFAVMSPTSMLDAHGDDDSEEDAIVRAQRALFRAAKRKTAGLDVDEEREELDLARFYSFFPGYEKDKNPRFVEFFPPRPALFRGKVPLKPPKPVQATKISLDLLPDQERAFRTHTTVNNITQDFRKPGIVYLHFGASGADDSDDELALSEFDETEVIGGVTMQDLALICEDWDMPSVETFSLAPASPNNDDFDGDYDMADSERPTKKQRFSILESDLSLTMQDPFLSFEEPERAAGRVAKRVALDLNDPNLLIDEHAPPPKKQKLSRYAGDLSRDPTVAKDLAKRYNISNDSAYDLLKENHQHKVRSTLGSMAVEHSLPATKLQYPFYKLTLEPKVKRSFHRPALHGLDSRREYKFQKLKTIKRKERRGREVKDLFPTAESLAHNDNSSMLLVEYSEEAPMMLSNFGMGNRLINYYRKRNADDQERPKREIGETQVLLTQDKSPFANFGHVDQGEIVPTLQNGMFRAPIFQHQPKAQDFLMSISTTHSTGSRFYLRNIENLHTVGQQFPLVEIPGEHSRKVTDAAKKRLRAISYRIYVKSLDPNRRDKQLDNHSIMPHLPGHDMPQTRSKMREFMKYEKSAHRENGVWVPPPNVAVPELETLRSWIKPEDICLLDSMQVGVQRLEDLGLHVSNGKNDDDDKEDDTSNIEVQLAPWRTTKNFLNATQGKAMLKLHGEGDPTGRGEGFSFVRTSMKGGFQALGESVEDRLDAKKRRETGGHSYNVAKQQKAYDDYIRMIWDRQKHSLNSVMEVSDDEEEPETDAETATRGTRAATPRSAYGTPAAFRQDDESASQFSRGSRGRSGKTLVIKRTIRDPYTGQDEVRYDQVTNPQVISKYKTARIKKRVSTLNQNLMDLQPTGDPEVDAFNQQQIEQELARIARNVDRRHAREKAKGKLTSPGPMGDSPGPSDMDAAAGDGSTAPTPQKGRGRNKDTTTARKCANCGQVGHIKTNRKSVYTCPLCRAQNKIKPARKSPQPPSTPRGSSKASQQGSTDRTSDSAASQPSSDSAATHFAETYSSFVL